MEKREQLDITASIGLWADRMARISHAEGDAYSALARECLTAKNWSPVNQLALSDRRARQALLLASVKLRTDRASTGQIPAKDVLKLARYFGYDARGTAGFYRRSPNGSPGLLIRHDGMVSIGSAGLTRIQEFQGHLQRHEADIQATRNL